jgi:DNA-binding NarL/FixJ family response regulator
MADRIRVLLADDHAVVREGLRHVLSACEDMLVVGEAEDGHQALNLTLQLAPDVLVLDIGMPGMDGISVTKRLRQHPNGTKVLILTVYENEEYLVPVLKAGASGYVPKRAAAADLVTAIRTVYLGDTYLHPSVTKSLVHDYLKLAEKSDVEGERDGLTAREIEILRLIAEGHTSREIADRLYLSVKTVQAHRTNIMQKLGVHDVASLVRYAIRTGLIS